MTVSTVNAPPGPPQFAQTQKSDYSVQIRFGPNFPFEFVPRDTDESEFSVLVNIGWGSF